MSLSNDLQTFLRGCVAAARESQQIVSSLAFSKELSGDVIDSSTAVIFGGVATRPAIFCCMPSRRHTETRKLPI